MVSRLIRGLTGYSLRGIYRGVIMLLHYLPKVAWTAMLLMATTASAIVRGIPGAVEAMADEWVTEYAEAGHSSEYQRWLFVGAEAVATIVIFLGWILLSFLTVFLVRLLI